ncbi:MAG TPA: 5-deoxy-glucuronate isomerase [Myxococcota bacterium]
MAHPAHITAHRTGFAHGTTTVIAEDGRADGVGVDFAIVKMSAGEVLDEAHAKESAWVLLAGRARVQAEHASGGVDVTSVSRESLFDDRPSALLVCGGARVRIAAETDAEWAVVRTASSAHFASRLYQPQDVTSEARGQGLVQDASLRAVRMIFDHGTRPDAALVIGEVVHMPGRWSSYPPHHHAQPELYHYRFDKPQGYGHAELGDDVVKVKHNDTVKIIGGVDHPQVAAPGYAMWYLWIVRHQKNAPYTGFTFADEHKWILDGTDAGWSPRVLR